MTDVQIELEIEKIRETRDMWDKDYKQREKHWMRNTWIAAVIAVIAGVGAINAAFEIADINQTRQSSDETPTLEK